MTTAQYAARITQVNFTFALDGGMWVRREDGTSGWHTFSQLTAELGGAECERLYRIAYANGMTGMWYNARNGGNVYANGQEVNA